MILPAQIGPAPRTGAQLRGGEGIRAVVGVETGDASVFEVGDEQAASAAVVGGAAGADFLDGGRMTDDRILLFDILSAVLCRFTKETVHTL